MKNWYLLFLVYRISLLDCNYKKKSKEINVADKNPQSNIEKYKN